MNQIKYNWKNIICIDSNFSQPSFLIFGLGGVNIFVYFNIFYFSTDRIFGNKFLKIFKFFFRFFQVTLNDFKISIPATIRRGTLPWNSGQKSIAWINTGLGYEIKVGPDFVHGFFPCLCGLILIQKLNTKRLYYIGINPRTTSYSVRLSTTKTYLGPLIRPMNSTLIVSNKSKAHMKQPIRRITTIWIKSKTDFCSYILCLNILLS